MSALGIFLAGLGLIVAVAAVVARPLLWGPRSAARGERERTVLEKRRDEALASLRDAEFDHALGKLSEEDYRELRDRLSAEAALAMRGLAKGAGKERG